MGKPMAINLIKAGFDVCVASRSQGPIDELKLLGAKTAQSVELLCLDSDVIITMLPTPEITRVVVLGDQGVIASMQKGTLFIDMGTESPQLAIDIDHTARKQGIHALDAPVSGGDVGAKNATLSIMVGGDPDAYERALPILKKLGSTIVRVGGVGAGQSVKAVNQIMVAGILATISEGLALLESSDVDISHALEALSSGRAGSALLSAKATQMLNRDYRPGFKVTLHLKDLNIVAEFARSRGIALPITALATQMLIAVEASGGGDLDHASIIEVTRNSSKLSL